MFSDGTRLTLISPPPGVCLMLSLDPTFGLALSLKSSLTDSIFLSPPPGLYVAFSRDPILDFAFHCSFCCWIYNLDKDYNTFFGILYFKISFNEMVVI